MAVIFLWPPTIYPTHYIIYEMTEKELSDTLITCFVYMNRYIVTNISVKEIYTFNHIQEFFPAFSTWAIHVNEHLKCHQHARGKVVLSAR